VYRTLFGTLRLQNDRLFHCPCQPHSTRTFSPLADRLPERTAPERLYLGAKFASLMSSGSTIKLLEEVLPWHGNVFRALQEIESITMDLDVAAAERSDNKVQKLLKAVEEFQTYIEHNAGFIPNYGERISTARRPSSSTSFC
jgi:hypothetical protein